jgi:hypothetical protein
VDEVPDIWIRHQNVQLNSTPNRYSWEHVKPTKIFEKNKELIEIDIVKSGTNNSYMVTVLHDKEEDTQTPVPMGKCEVDVASPIDLPSPKP